ncbi:hypothetical protein CTEN210_06837 [Chaetoceros tenuissimus]|uniref:CSD domain-containing protein n=1 Tax=Chaetoceros tenuissimus TaxID=426638 RepID=A0AAD3CSG1_9STRA|nr:hypothetical protein CTEN210_06837 [Chaetoceros tenuissimus]
MSSSEPRMQATVKWFSSKKGYGFLIPDASTAPPDLDLPEDIFVHQSVISSEGYRTLYEDWRVEFTLSHDEHGKPTAEQVTSVGGGFVSGPKPKKRSKKEQEASEEETTGEDTSLNASRNTTSGKKTPQAIWHDSLHDSVKVKLDELEIPRTSGTLDISLGDARIKLGSLGYASLADANKNIAEGTFESTGSGNITLHWTKHIQFNDAEGVWEKVDFIEGLVSNLDLMDENIKKVEAHETMATLMGEDLPNPKSTLEAAGFLMRRVLLVTKKRRGRK